MNRKCVAKIALGGFALLWLSTGCNTAPRTRQITAVGERKDSTSYQLRGDSILPPLKYDLNEIVNYPNGNQPPIINLNDYKDHKYLHFIDGRMVENKDKEKAFKRLSKAEIKSFQFIPAEEAFELYGQKAVNGVVIIETNKED